MGVIKSIKYRDELHKNIKSVTNNSLAYMELKIDLSIQQDTQK